MSGAARRSWASYLPRTWDEDRAEEEAQSEASESELRQRELREEKKRLEAVEEGGVRLIVCYIVSLGC
jgi:hypothetical protein